jgi:hypothetical protein
LLPSGAIRFLVGAWFVRFNAGMDAFSYLSVLLSIIIGLAITQVLQGYRALLLAKARVRSDGTALLWSVSLLLFATQAWWASFGLREHREWSFLAFAIVLLQMILLYMMSAVVLPDVGDEQEIDLSEHFAEHRKLFFGILLAMLGASVLKDFILTGGLPTPTNLLFHVIFATAAIVALLAANRRVQLGLAVVAALGFGVYIAVLFGRL